MDNQQGKEQLKYLLGQIPSLRSLRYGNPTLEQWKNEVCRILASIYGDNSIEYRRFVNAPGKSFVVYTDMGMDNEYQRQLDCYKEAVETLI